MLRSRVGRPEGARGVGRGRGAEIRSGAASSRGRKCRKCSAEGDEGGGGGGGRRGRGPRPSGEQSRPQVPQVRSHRAPARWRGSQQPSDAQLPETCDVRCESLSVFFAGRVDQRSRSLMCWNSPRPSKEGPILSRPRSATTSAPNARFERTARFHVIFAALDHTLHRLNQPTQCVVLWRSVRVRVSENALGFRLVVG